MNRNLFSKLLVAVLGLQLAVPGYLMSEKISIPSYLSTQWNNENINCTCNRPLHDLARYMGYAAMAKVGYDLCHYGWKRFKKWLCSNLEPRHACFARNRA